MPYGADLLLIDRFLEMMAAEAGASKNTLLAYQRDLVATSELLEGRLGVARTEDLSRLASAWCDLANSSLARRSASLRRFFGFLADEGLRNDNPSSALARPTARRVLPKILSREDVDSLFAEIEVRLNRVGPVVRPLRLLALVELLYGSGLRATELVSLDIRAIVADRPFAILRGKGGKERLVPISDRARKAV